MYKRSSSSSSTSSSPVQTMSENGNLINSFIITNGLVSRLSSNESLIGNQSNNEKKVQQTTALSKSTKNVSINQKKQQQQLKKLNITNCEVQSDATILKLMPQVFDRFIEVVDSVTKESCQMMMCKACRHLLKKNTEMLLSHLCKQKDLDKFSNIPVINNQLIFRSKPKNRATPIWDEFEEVIEPSSNLLLGYARCKRCLEIIKTADPKSIPAVLRRHIPQCPCGPFPSSLLVTSNKSTSSSENNHTNSSNHEKTSNSINSNSKLTINSLNNSLNKLNSSNVSNNLTTLFKENNLSSLLSAVKKLTNQNNLNNLNLTNLNGLNNLNNFNSHLNGLISNSNLNSSSVAVMPMANNLNNLANKNSTTNSNHVSPVTSASSKLNHFKNEFRERCIELCFKEMVSLETIRSPAFKRLCQTILQLGNQMNSRQLQLPDISQLDNQLYTQYSTLRFQLKNDLQLELCKSIGGALVCDSQEDLCILATYYINSNWKLKEIVLSGDAYGNEINGFITNTLNDYHLNEEDKLGKFTFVSRGGHFDGVNVSLTSISHTIDHIINNTIFYDDTYTDIIENCRLTCNELGIEVKIESMVENVDWIAKYEILKHVLINVDKYELANYPLNFDLIKFLVNLLTPFRNASCELRRNCSLYPTLNHVLLWYYKIIKLLEEDEDKTSNDQPNDEELLDDELDDSAFIKKAKKSIRDAVEEFFEIHSLHKIATFLWPNFRSLKMLTSDERKKVHEEIRKLIETRISNSKDENASKKEDDSYEFEIKPKKARTDFSDWEETSPIIGQDELTRYINETLPTCDETSILDWWREHQSKFPKLAQLAKWILSLPASVTLIEKFKLNNSPKVEEEILFLHCNLYDEKDGQTND